jgi:hypothetical protein
MYNFKKYLKSKFNRLIYKKISPFVGRVLDKLFFTSFSRIGINFYHFYERNDYLVDNKDLFCFVHLPRTAGISTRIFLEENNIKIYNFPKNAFHNPVSLNCPPDKFKYFTIMRNPIDRVYSQFKNYGSIGGAITEHGLIYTLRTQKTFKNLACQYYSGLIGEHVDERVFEIAKKNINNFHYIINFNSLEEGLNKFVKKFEVDKIVKIKPYNINKYDKISDSQKEIIETYNYWDLKLYNYYKMNLTKKI